MDTQQLKEQEPPGPAGTEARQRLALAVIHAERVWAHYRALPTSQLPGTWASIAMGQLLDLIHAAQPLIDPQAAVSQPPAPPDSETAEPR